MRPGDIAFKNFNNNFALQGINPGENFRKVLRWHVHMWLDHRFDLLGSGWVSRNKGTKPPGYMGFTVPEYKAEAIDSIAAYHPIDWQMDIKSGFRWDEKKKSAEQTGFLDTPYGVDVKMPWELARMYHLPLLVLSGHLFPDLKEDVQREFHDILNDFFENNPYGMGINWSNAMEVGIRLVNILLATDFLTQQNSDGSIFNEYFVKKWEQAIFEHVKYILEHSEYKNGLSNNHYYTNISSLLFAGSFFSETITGKNLLNLGFEEVVSETSKQFLPDGSNFESSTHYHRLSTEMLLWNLNVILKNKHLIKSGMAGEFQWNNYKTYSQTAIADKISALQSFASKALHFSYSITKPNGNITSCGDQDSGRFLKLDFAGEFKCFEELKHKFKQIGLGEYNEDLKAIWWVENDLDHRFLQAMQASSEEDGVLCIQGMFFRDMKLESNFEKSLSGGNKSFSQSFPYNKTSIIRFDQNFLVDVDSLKWSCFEDFGIYIIENETFFLSVMATNNHLPRYWSHGKNDKLSFELQVNGKDVILDPGSFIYSADVQTRNLFRSTQSHSTIHIDGREQNRWPDGKYSIFNLYNESKCELISLSQWEIVLLCSYRKVRHRRAFRIHPDRLEIVDDCNMAFGVSFNHGELYSNHYGRWINPENAS